MRSTDAATDAADTDKRLTLLLAALLWDNGQFHADVYERHAAEDDRQSPDLRLVELTEDGRLEILADGREYVLRVEPAPLGCQRHRTHSRRSRIPWGAARARFTALHPEWESREQASSKPPTV